jgi:hypothetical protein
MRSEIRRAPLAVAMLLVIAAGAQGPKVSAADQDQDPGVRFYALASGEVTLGGDAAPSVRPAAEIEVDGPLPIGGKAPLRVYARFRTFGLPGETIDLSRVDTFRAASFDGGFNKRIGRQSYGAQEIWTSIEIEYGFATITSPEASAAIRYPRHYGIGFRLEERTGGAWLSVLYGRDESAGDRGWGQYQIGGGVPLGMSKGAIVLGGDAVLSAGRPGGDPTLRQRDTFRLYVAVSLPELVGAFRR